MARTLTPISGVRNDEAAALESLELDPVRPVGGWPLGHQGTGVGSIRQCEPHSWNVREGSLPLLAKVRVHARSRLAPNAGVPDAQRCRRVLPELPDGREGK